MPLKSIDASVLSIPFNAAFKHASAERSMTEALWVEATTQSGVVGFGEGCPRQYVTAETVSTANEFVASFRDRWITEIRDMHSLSEWVRLHRSAIDQNPAAWTAVELAVLDAFAKERGCSIEALLGLRPLAGRFCYTAVLGDGSIESFQGQLNHYLRLGFRQFKIKLSGALERDLGKVLSLSEAGVTGDAVRADANNLWADAGVAAAHLEALDYRFFALEEPLGPNDYAGLKQLAQRLDTRIILDESCLREDQLAGLPDPIPTWIVNLRVSKMGGLLRSLRLLRSIRERGVGLIVGAHVGETSILTRAALTVANCARDILVAQEGAFGTYLLNIDVADPPLMFGEGGVIDIDKLGMAGISGLGLDIRSRQGN
jgi:L-alanine-DL-glutamate epimerase-like enolase superfamily enzyme